MVRQRRGNLAAGQQVGWCADNRKCRYVAVRTRKHHRFAGYRRRNRPQVSFGQRSGFGVNRRGRHTRRRLHARGLLGGKHLRKHAGGNRLRLLLGFRFRRSVRQGHVLGERAIELIRESLQHDRVGERHAHERISPHALSFGPRCSVLSSALSVTCTRDICRHVRSPARRARLRSARQSSTKARSGKRRWPCG